jgi:cysteine desulfurase
MKSTIYLDNHATTAVDPQVVEAMLPYFQEHFGNAASRQHAYGWHAQEAVDQAREQVATLIGAKGKEIVFTSGATESNNLALLGAARRSRPHGNHIISVTTEHHAVLDPLKQLEKEGFTVTLLPVQKEGLLDLKKLEQSLTDQTILISIMAANNEIGTIHPLKEIGQFTKELGILFHTDAAQALGKIYLDVEEIGIDLLSLSAHKTYGPKGTGALFVRSRNPHVSLEPIMYGGGHEHDLRSGTLAVPLIVGLGKACEIAGRVMQKESKRIGALRDRLHDGICSQVDGVVVNGATEARLPNNLNLRFNGLQADALMMQMKGLAVSSGSACTSAKPEPSHVLRALGLSKNEAHSSLRFGLGRFTREEEIVKAIAMVVEAVKVLRNR